MILTLLPVLLQLFQSCKKPPTPTPNPIPTPTPAQAKAWDLKCTATDGYDESDADYDRPLLHRTAQACRREKRQGGEKCTRRESLELARAALDEARLGDIDEIAAGIVDANAE